MGRGAGLGEGREGIGRPSYFFSMGVGAGAGAFRGPRATFGLAGTNSPLGAITMARFREESSTRPGSRIWIVRFLLGSSAAGRAFGFLPSLSSPPEDGCMIGRAHSVLHSLEPENSMYVSQFARNARRCQT